MSIERDRVSATMFRSIFCCYCCFHRTAKVRDEAAQPEMDMSQHVLLICTEQLVARSLFGKFVSKLEDKMLKSVSMMSIKPDPEKLSKSQLVKAERNKTPETAWIVTIWRGDNVQNKVAETVKEFKTQYALPKNAIYFTDSPQVSVNEQNLWFREAALTTTIVANGEAEHKVEAVKEGELHIEDLQNQEQPGVVIVEQPRADSDANENAVIQVLPNERANEIEPEYSSEGPLPSVNSSQIPSRQSPQELSYEPKINDQENAATAEVISNTVDMIQPEVVVNAPTPLPPSQ